MTPLGHRSSFEDAFVNQSRKPGGENIAGNAQIRLKLAEFASAKKGISQNQ